MSDTNNFETGYQDDDNTVGPDNTGTGNGNGNGNASTGFGAPTSRARPAGKKGSKVPLVIFGVLAVLGIGAGAWFMLGGSAPPAPARPPVATPAVDPAADQTADDQGSGQDASASADSQSSQIDPITGLPVTDPAVAASTAVDPITGLPVADPAAAASSDIDPITGLPVADPSQAQPAPGPNEIDPSTIPAASSGVDPITGLPVSDPAQTQPTIDTTGAQGNDPITGLPVSDPAQIQVSPDPVAQPVQQPAPIASDDPLAQFRDMLAPIDSRVTNLEAQVSTLTSRVDDISKQVDRLADRPRNNNSINVGSAPAPRRRAASTARKPAASNNYVRVSDSPRVSPPVSRVVIVSQGSPAHQALQAGASPESIIQQAQPAPHTASVRSVSVADSQPDAAPAPSCNLQAIVPGRVWVKNSDGSFSSYGEGETWNGQTVGTIDPARGVKLGNRWVCN